MANLNLHLSAPQQLPCFTAAQLRARLLARPAQRSAASAPRASAGTASASGARANGVDASSAGRRLVLEDPPPVSHRAPTGLPTSLAARPASKLCLERLSPAVRVRVAGNSSSPGDLQALGLLAKACMDWMRAGFLCCGVAVSRAAGAPDGHTVSLMLRGEEDMQRTAAHAWHDWFILPRAGERGGEGADGRAGHHRPGEERPHVPVQ